MIRIENFTEVVEKMVAAGATKSNQFNFYHTWWGWVSKDVLHITSTSGARRRSIWHFGVEKNSDRELFLKNTTGTADCWTQIAPHMEQDPYERILRMCRQSKKILHRHQPGERVEFSGQLANLYCHVPGRSSSSLKTDSMEEIRKEKIIESSDSQFTRQPWEASLSEATWAVVYESRADHNGRVDRYIKALHIWGEPNVEEVAKAVGSYIFCPGASLAYLEARATGQSLSWLKGIVEPGRDFNHILLDGEEYEIILDTEEKDFGLRSKTKDGFVLAAKWVFGPDSIAATVFNGMKKDVRLALLPQAQRQYAQSLLNIEIAKKFIRENMEFCLLEGRLYRVIKGRLILVETDRPYIREGEIGIFNRIFFGDDLVEYAKEIAKKEKN